VFGARFIALVAYSPHESVAFASAIAAEDLDSLGALNERWHHEGLATPLVVTPDEFQRSLDAFPLEYQAILDQHVVIAGQNPIARAAVSPADLRRACEASAKGHLIHLRQGWLQAAGHRDRQAALIVRSAAPLRALLVSLARLLDTPAASTADLPAFAARTIGIPDTIVREVLALEDAPEGAETLIAHMREYLAASEQLWAFVDRWRSA